MRNFFTLRSAPSFAVTCVAALAFAGCSGGTTSVLTPQPGGTVSPTGSASVAPTTTPAATATPTAGGYTPTPSPTPTVASASPTPTPTPTPTATGSPAFTITTSSQFNNKQLNFPQVGESGACPAGYYTQTISASETGYSGAFQAVSGNTAEVTIMSTGSATFTATDTNSSSGTQTTVTVSDSIGHSVPIPVTFNVVCL